MDRERVAFVAPGLEHDRGPEVPNDREMPGPGLVRDGGREDGAERRVAPHLGVEAVDHGGEPLFGELSPARRFRDGGHAATPLSLAGPEGRARFVAAGPARDALALTCAGPHAAAEPFALRSKSWITSASATPACTSRLSASAA